METGVFSLDVSGVAALYDTSAGVGLAGRVDTKEGKHGRHPAWLIVAFAVVLFLCLAVPYALGKLVGVGSRKLVEMGSGMTQGFTAGASNLVHSTGFGVARSPDVSPGVAGRGEVGGEVVRGGRRGEARVGEDGAKVRLVGVAFCGTLDLCRWRLSDGDLITCHSPGFGGGSGSWLILDGVRYEYDSTPLAVHSAPARSVLDEVDRPVRGGRHHSLE